MAKIDFDDIKNRLKTDRHPMLAGITLGDKVIYKLHESTKKKKKRKKRSDTIGSKSFYKRRGYLGAWCPWWMPYDTDHGQGGPVFNPDAGGGSGTTGGGEAGGVATGGDAGCAACGGGVVAESIYCTESDETKWEDLTDEELAILSKSNPTWYLKLSCDHLGMTDVEKNALLKAFDEEKNILIDAISPMGGLAISGSKEADHLYLRNGTGAYTRGLVWDKSANEVSAIYVGRGKETPGCWWDNFSIFTSPDNVDGVVIGESADNGLFFESVDDAVGFMISSKLVEVSPESAHDTANMLKNGVADAIACYTPTLPKKHPFKVFKVTDVPTETIRRYIVESQTDSDNVFLEALAAKDYKTAKDVFDRRVNEVFSDGYLGTTKMYHGTFNDFNRFERGDIGFHFGTEDAAFDRVDNTGTLDGVKDFNVKAYYLNIKNPFWYGMDIGTWNGHELADMLLNDDPELVDGYELTDDDRTELESIFSMPSGNEYTSECNVAMRDFLKKRGFDSIAYPNAFEGSSDDYSYVVLDAENIKLADMITYDESNNVIPPSKRFNFSSTDVRESDESDVEIGEESGLGEYANDIMKFFGESGFAIDPIPEIEWSESNSDDVTSETGRYLAPSKKIVVFTNGRHVKDILRSFCHELWHHVQNIKDPSRFDKQSISGDISDNKELNKLENEAYSMGNNLFRKWTIDRGYKKPVSEKK